MKNNKPIFGVLLLLQLLVINSGTHSQNIDDYRSKLSGNWSDPATWQYYNGTNWVNAANSPNSLNGLITIRNGHNVAMDQDKTVDQVVIEAGSRMTVNSSITLTTSDGAGDEITVYGTLLYQGLVPASMPGTGVLKNGGTYIHNTTGSAVRAVDFFTVKETSSNWIYRGSDNTSTPVSLSGRTYGNLAFESTSNIYSFNFTGTTPLTVNGNFELGSNVTMTITNTAVNVFKGNYTVSGSIVYSTGVQNFSFAGNSEQLLSGTLNFEIMSVSSGAVVKQLSNLNISNALNVAGVLNCTDRTTSGAGALNLLSGSTVINANAGGINGSFINSGLKNIASDVNYEFNGTVSQSTGLLLSTCSILRINNSSGVVLSGAVTVNGILDMVSGCLNIGNNNLVIGSAGIISGAGQTNFVSTNGTGYLKKLNVPPESDFLFPIGNVTYSPATLRYSGAQDNFRASVKNTLDHTPNGTAYINKQWTISEDVPGGTNASLSFQWNISDQNSGFCICNDTYIGKYSGSGYIQTPAVISGAGPYTATSGGFTSFSDFAVGNENVLPVRIMSMDFEKIQDDVLLKWSTEYESNNSGFIVQRRNIRDSSWSKPGFVSGKGSSNIRTDYSFRDRNLKPGKYYYRLVQVDNNGNSTVFEINKLCIIEVPPGISLGQNFPNPFNSKTNISFILNEESTVSFYIYDISGKLIKSFPGTFQIAGYHTIIFDGSGLSSGTYIYRMKAESKQRTVILYRKFTIIK